jgi:uncharacterized protein (DUF1015 family)
MATVKPFQAVRATRDKVALVSSRSYDAYSPAELGAQLDFNPYSFLHIISPNYANHEKISLNDRFKAIKSKYEEFKDKHTYIKDEFPVYYIYQKITKNTSFIGIIAATSSFDYENDVIKKHEKTLKKREILFKNYLKATGFNAEPVLLTYPDNDKINTVINKYQQQRAEYEFTTRNKKKHLLWIVKDVKDVKMIFDEFQSIKSLYIADGHHRSASSYLLAKDLAKDNPNHTGKEAYNFCLSYLISESNLQISEFNRLVKNLNGLSKADFLKKLEKRFIITKLTDYTYKPTKTHSFSMYIDDEVYLLEFQKNKPFKSSLHQLDTHILYKYILKKILGIKDLRRDKRIAYANCKKGQAYLKEQVLNGNYRVAFGLYPISVQEMKNVADEGLKMPPKSTYILPKLRSGLTIYEF